MRIGTLRHRVTLQSVTRTADGDAGATEVWADLSPSDWWVSIEPATSAVTERVLGAKLVALASHVIRGHYRSDLTTACRLVYGSRTFAIRGIQNAGERNIELVLACEELSG